MENKTIIDTDICFNCINYLYDLKCLAFPDRILDEVLKGSNDHTKPLPGQGNEFIYEDKNTVIF